MRAVEEKHGLIVELRWTDADITFQKLAFDNWVLNDNLEVEPKRLFKAWIEDDWEWECIEDKKEVKKMTLLRKYQGMHDKLMVAKSVTMEWQGGRSGLGWSARVIGMVACSCTFLTR
jgi:hypothetical protein